MNALGLLLLAIAAYWWWRTRGPGRTTPVHRRTNPGPIQGAGASADAHARELRTPTVRIATAIGIPTQAEARAQRFEIGAIGERYVASLLGPLVHEGWTFLADRRLPHGNANVDILAISPKRKVYVLDPKKWTSRHRLTVHNGRLLHGTWDVSERMRGLVHETRTVSRLLGVPAMPVAAMDGPMQPGTRLTVTVDRQTIRLVPASDICDALRALDRQRIPAQTTAQSRAQLVATAKRLLPPKTRK
ncbi:nuclease-related domain-containing protein [Streptomyces sp. AD55]|uniref:nuclease-related domain-containing protein n=1 Tax=Streptomyces sp. AD55 TaxID=3242895 RepID=UPI00352769C0